jgi:hypothetical protein
MLGGKELVRFSYLHVFKPHLNSQSGKQEYSVRLHIPKTSPDGKEIKQLIDSMKKAMFADKKKPVPPGFWNPLRDGDTDTKQDGTGYGDDAKGCYVINAKASIDYPPSVLGTTRGPNGKPLPLTGGVKSGDYGRALIRLYGYYTGTSGVGVGLSALQFVMEGDSLGGDSGSEAFDEFLDEDQGITL